MTEPTAPTSSFPTERYDAHPDLSDRPARYLVDPENPGLAERLPDRALQLCEVIDRMKMDTAALVAICNYESAYATGKIAQAILEALDDLAGELAQHGIDQLDFRPLPDHLRPGS